MRQEWRHLLFLHWPVEPRALERLLPQGLEVDTFEGAAWIGLVPFTILPTRPPVLPLPVLPSFHEVNLRTYVRWRGGDPGVFFFSLDAASRIAVAGARTWYRLPYHFARMRMIREGTCETGGEFRIRYESNRLWPGPLPARCTLRYGPIPGLLAPATPGTLDHFLVERYLLYTVSRGRLRRARVAHAPYSLRPAAFDSLDETLSRAAGLPGPSSGDRLAHYSPGVSVDIFAPEVVERTASTATTLRS
jgi:uncharacterized protein YqjF (DUF2071 family)